MPKYGMASKQTGGGQNRGEAWVDTWELGVEVEAYTIAVLDGSAFGS